MYELSLTVNAISGIQPAYGWHAPYRGLPTVCRSSDRIATIRAICSLLASGPISRTRFSPAGSSLRRYTDATEKDDEAFGFTRLPR